MEISYSKYIEFSIYALFLLPKIPLTENSGILIGELMLLIGFIFNFYKPIRLQKELVLYILFVFYLYILSSLTSGLFIGVFPIEALLFFFRFLIFIEIYKFFERKSSHLSYHDLFLKYFYYPFLFNFFISFMIFIIEFLHKNPSFSEIMWGYEVGFRLIPITGLAINFSSINIIPLNVVGGGSANVIFAFTFFNLIFSYYLNYKFKIVLLISIIYVMLSLSRGSMLTLIFFIFFVFLFSKKITMKNKFIIFLIIIITIIIFNFLFENYNLPNVFERIFSTIENGNLDPSSKGRIENYKDFFKVWANSPFSILFGIGNDQEIYQNLVNRNLIESFYLQVLFGTGIIGCLILLYYYYNIYFKSKNNIEYKILITYIIFQSFINWSVTGGDFLSPINIFLFFSIMGIHESRKNGLLTSY